jgi:hypothetical protein
MTNMGWRRNRGEGKEGDEGRKKFEGKEGIS